jgi:trimeric autotransporter adhesin
MNLKFTPAKGVYLILLTLLTLSFFSCKNSMEVEKDLNKKAMLKAKFEQDWAKYHDPYTNTYPVDRLVAAQDYVNKNFGHLSNYAVSGITWVERGPNNVGGRVNAILFDKNDATNNTIFVGGVSGGLWKCTTLTAATPTWTKITDILDNIAITCLVQDPNNSMIMYLGTGDEFAQQGYGIWKSTNGGANWTHLPSTSSSKWTQMKRLLMKSNGNLYAATLSDVSKSTDGGVTWQSLLGEDCSDLAVAANGDIYASNYFGKVFKSLAASDGAPGSWTTYTLPGTNGRTALALAPTDAQKVYAIGNDPATNDCAGIYRSDNGGASWTTGGNPTNVEEGGTNWCRGQGWYNLTCMVDPNNSSTLVIGGIDIFRSTNGAASFSQLTVWNGAAHPVVHSDHHAMVFVPGSSTQAVFGCDGGMYYSSNITSTFKAINTGLNITQFYYGAATNVAAANYFIAGAQDNGTPKFTNPGLGNTTDQTGGDGGFVHIDPLNANLQFASYVYSVYYKSTNGGTSWGGTINDQTHGQFINPTAFDSVSKVMYGDYTLVSTNTGGSYARWLTSGATNTGVAVTNFAGTQADVIYVSPNVLNRVYFGCRNGSLVYVDAANTGTSKAGVIVKAASAGDPSGIAIETGNESHILLTYSSYGVQHVLETTNGGTAWTDISGNLPDIPVNWVIFYPGSKTQALIATDLGVWSTNLLNGANTEWSPTNVGMPNTKVSMIGVRYADNTLYAATYGRGLFTSTLTNTPLPQVHFRDQKIQVSEKSSGTTNCGMGTTTIPVTVMITGAPTANVTVQVAAMASSTATAGLDYTLATNTATFTPASYGPKTVNITINDDDIYEGSEYIALNYTITAGAANAQVGTTFQTTEVEIVDDETAPVIASTSSVQSGVYNTNLGPSSPLQATNSDKRIQYHYKASSLLAQGLKPGMITNVSFLVNSKGSTAAYNGLTFKIAQTATADLTAGYVTPASWTTIYSGNYTSTFGINTFAIAGGFLWDGVSNIIFDFCYDNSATQAGDDILNGENAGYNAQVRTFATSGAGCSFGNGSPGYVVSLYRPVFTLSQPIAQTAVETVLNSTNSFTMNTAGIIYFYNPSNSKIMASIQSLSAFDYGCTSVTIDRAGTTSKPFWYAAPASTFLTDKTFRVIPTTNNPTGQYTITLYYTAAEKAGWEAATGNSWNNIMMVKTAGPISAGTPATPVNAEVVTPTRSTFGTDYTLSYTFNTGFSGFAAGIPGTNPIPITLLNFTGQLQSGNALLQWTTTQELNSKLFEIQRSLDGVNFVKIGSVNAAGNSASQRRYTFLDNSMRAVNYYRLKMVDLDNNSKLSNVVLLKNDNIAQQVYVLTNPFGNYIDLQFAKIPTGNVSLRLLDISGKQLSSGTYNNVGYNLHFSNVGMVLSRGIYILEAQVDGTRYTYKLVRQ